MNKRQADYVLGSKQAAKKDIAALLWPTLGATGLFLLPIVLLSAALLAACGGASLEALSELSARQIWTYIAIYLLANFLIVQPLYYGLTQFYALQRAGGRTSAFNVTVCLTSFQLYFRSLRMALVVGLFSVLWLIPFGMLCGAGVALYRYILPNNLGWFLCIEIIIVAMVGYVCMVMRYHCAYALLVEQPKLGSWAAVRQAVDKFHGHNREMFSLVASFMIWYLLTVMFGSLLLLVLCPYFLLSVYHLFDRIRGVELKVVTRRIPEDEKKRK